MMLLCGNFRTMCDTPDTCTGSISRFDTLVSACTSNYFAGQHSRYCLYFKHYGVRYSGYCLYSKYFGILYC